LIQVTDDGGKTWRKVEKFPGRAVNTYVSRLLRRSTSANWP